MKNLAGSKLLHMNPIKIPTSRDYDCRDFETLPKKLATQIMSAASATNMMFGVASREKFPNNPKGLFYFVGQLDVLCH